MKIVVDEGFGTCYTICMEEKLVISRTYTYKTLYHVVWTVKRRVSVLDDNVACFLYEVLYDFAKKREFDLLSVSVRDRERVDCYINAPPTVSVSEIFKKITTQSLRMSSDQKYKEGDGPAF